MQNILKSLKVQVVSGSRQNWKVLNLMKIRKLAFLPEEFSATSIYKFITH